MVITPLLQQMNTEIKELLIIPQDIQLNADKITTADKGLKEDE